MVAARRRGQWQRSSVLAGLMAFCTVCGESGPGLGDAPEAGLSFRQIRLEGLRADAVAAGNPVWRSKEEFGRFWEAHSDAPRPEIDFRERSIVAVFLGERPNAGYSVEITRVEASDGGIAVHYRELLPNPERDYAAVITYPYAAVEVSRVLGDATFSGSRRVEQ